MKKLFVVTLLIYSNLYTMECFQKGNKPYQTKNKTSQKYYAKLMPSFLTKKDAKPKKKNQFDCLTGVIRAVSRILVSHYEYLNK
jgi:hypothetical protein